MAPWVLIGLLALGPAPLARASPRAPAAEPASEDEPTEQAPASTDPPEQEPIEVVVQGTKPMVVGRAAAQHSLKPREIERVPGAFGDPFRVIEVLPGVAPLASGLPHLFARGAVASSTGYYIDDIRVPFLFHLGVGPSVINPAVIHGLEFYPGAFPAKYGRHAGAIAAASTRPPYPRVRAVANVRLFDAGAFLETPFAEQRAHAFAGGRYSFAGPILSLFAPDTRLSYWDYVAGGGYRVAPNERLSLLTFGSNDYLGEVQGGREQELFAVQFHRVHLRLEREPEKRARGGGLGRGARVRLGATYGYDRTGMGEEGILHTDSYGLRVDAEVPAGEHLRLRGGVELEVADRIYVPGPEIAATDPAAAADDTEEEEAEDEQPEDETEPPEDDEPFDFDFDQVFGSGQSLALGAYLDAVIQPLPEVEIVPGLRAEGYAEQDAAAGGLAPRGLFRLRPTAWLTTTTAAGLAHQRPALALAVPGLEPRVLGGGLQQALQLVQGLELAFPDDWSASLSGFVHFYSNLTDLLATCGAGIDGCRLEDRADGRAYGLEVMVRRPLTREIGGFVSYTLSRSERTFMGETTLADFDRTHVFHGALGVELGAGWHAGARLSFYSGRPYSLLAFDDPVEPEVPTLVGKRNALRRPIFYRLDARLEKRWRIGETGWVSVVLEGMNLTLRKEIVDFDCRIASFLGGRGGLSCGGQEIGPITIPSLGVSGGI